MEEIYHKYKKINGIETLVIYVNYPDEYEFSLDFNAFKNNVKKVSDKIREYAFKNIGTVSNQTALLILNGVVVGTMILTKLNMPKKIDTLGLENNAVISENIEVIEDIPEENVYQKKIEDISQEEVENTNDNIKVENNLNNKSISLSQSNANNYTNSNTNSKTASSQSQVQGNPVTTVPETNTVNVNNSNEEVTTPSSTITNTQETTNPPAVYEKTINLKLKSGSVISIPLEEYVVGVVGSEMPAAFNVEALKAQAVAARTYALKKDAIGKVLSATVSDQTYKTIDELKSLWGASFNTYYNKVKSAVDLTKGEYMTYNGTYIDALYFSTSNGKTEDPKYVWGNDYPYIKTVDSSVDKNVSSYKYTKTISLSEFCSKLGVTVSNNNDINILSRTSGDRINEINIGGKIFTGVNVRTILALRSADFIIDISGNNVVIMTYGFGHGCGMSQYGANELAKQGYSYSQILHHYYTNIQIQK